MATPVSRGGMSGAALLVSGLAAVSALLGLVRDVVIAGVYGAGPALDAYFVGQGLMNIVLGLLAGAVAKASIPVFARAARAPGAPHREVAASLSRTASVALSTLLVVLGAASVLMYLAAAPITTVLAPGFDGEQAALATRLTRVLLASTVLVAATNLLAGLAQAHRRFFFSALEGVPFNLVMIAAAGVLGPRYGISALAAGFVTGSAARLVCQLPGLSGLGLRLRPSLRLGDPGARQIGHLLPPLLLGSALTNVNTLVDRAVASTLADGVISSLSYGWRLISLADTLLTVSVVTVSYPAFAAALSDRPELTRLLDRSLRTVVTVLVPVVALLLVAGTPLVALVYERGSFTDADTAATATAVLWYAPALVAMAWRELVTRASYALGDTGGPVVVGVLAMVVNAAGDLTVGRLYGIAGLAGSTTLAILVAAAANSWLLSRRHDLPVAGHALAGLWRVGVAGATATALAAGLVALTGEVGTHDASTWRWIGTVAVAGSAVLATYWSVLVLLRAPERECVTSAIAVLRGRVGRGRRRNG